MVYLLLVLNFFIGCKCQASTASEESNIQHQRRRRPAPLSLDFSNKRIVNYTHSKDEDKLSSLDVMHKLQAYLREQLLPTQRINLADFLDSKPQFKTIIPNEDVLAKIYEKLERFCELSTRNKWQEFLYRLNGHKLTPKLASPLYKALEISVKYRDVEENNPLQAVNFSQCHLGQSKSTISSLILTLKLFQNIRIYNFENNDLELTDIKKVVDLARLEGTRYISICHNSFTPDEAIEYFSSKLPEKGLQVRKLANKFILCPEEDLEYSPPSSDFWTQSWIENHKKYYKCRHFLKDKFEVNI